MKLVENINAHGNARLQNFWHEYFDAKDVFWTDHTFPQRLVVLELRDEFVEKGDGMMAHIDKVTYTHIKKTNK